VIFLIIIALLVYKNLSFSILEDLFKSDKEIQDKIKHTLHELNTPVSTIKLNTKMLLKQINDEKSIEKLNRISKSCEDLLNLYTEMEYSIKKEVNNIQKEDIYLDEIINNSIDKFYDIKKDITISYDKTNMKINSDKKGLQVVIDNILSNAIKYNKENGSIQIYTNNNKLYIKDSGIGIDIKNVFKVYDKYYQENSTNKGFGMGLYTVKLFCDNNNIKFSINSKNNEGTEISLLFYNK
jgi:signal transduction histidine kinase